MKKIDRAELRGAIDAVGMGRGFLQPLFMCPALSNEWLVQLGDGNGCVAQFVPVISSIDDQKITKLTWKEEVAVKRPMLWAFQLEPETIVVAPHNEFNLQLQAELDRHGGSISPFLRLEVEELFGSKETIANAVARAYRSLSDLRPAWGRHWLNRVWTNSHVREHLARVGQQFVAGADFHEQLGTLVTSVERGRLVLDGNKFLNDWLNRHQDAVVTAMGDVLAAHSACGQPLTTVEIHNPLPQGKTSVRARSIQPMNSKSTNSKSEKRGEIFVVSHPSWGDLSRRMVMALVKQLDISLATAGNVTMTLFGLDDFEKEKHSRRVRFAAYDPDFEITYDSRSASARRRNQRMRYFETMGTMIGQMSSVGSLAVLCGFSSDDALGTLLLASEFESKHAVKAILVYRSMDEFESNWESRKATYRHRVWSRIDSVLIVAPRSKRASRTIERLPANISKKIKFCGFVGLLDSSSHMNKSGEGSRVKLPANISRYGILLDYSMASPKLVSRVVDTVQQMGNQLGLLIFTDGRARAERIRMPPSQKKSDLVRVFSGIVPPQEMLKDAQFVIAMIPPGDAGVLSNIEAPLLVLSGGTDDDQERGNIRGTEVEEELQTVLLDVDSLSSAELSQAVDKFVSAVSTGRIGHSKRALFGGGERKAVAEILRAL